MRIYLDSSAIVKLVQRETESGALRRYLRRHRDDERVTSTLARVEVVRAVRGGGPTAITTARRQLSRMYQVSLDPAALDGAATLGPGIVLRSLDAIHIASAQVLVPQLRALVTYDQRMAVAAHALGVPVDAPA